MNRRAPNLRDLSALLATVFAQRAKRAGQWHIAARYYRIALLFNPENAARLVQYGNALRQCGALAEAEQAYDQSLQLDPGDPDAHVQLGHALKLQRRGNDALTAYRRAVSLDPLLHDASRELLALGFTAHIDRSALPALRASGATAGSSSRPLIAFDATDMLNHFLRSRSATGIQRVQSYIIASLLQEPNPSFEVAIVYFQQWNGEWINIAPDFFLELIDLARSPPAPPELDWRRAVQQLIAFTVHGEKVKFRDDTALVNLGTSWSLANYFLKIRMIKARHRLRYVPFVHDCIPALFPELCAPQTVKDYLDWASGVFRHADGFLVNSLTTARDLTALAAALGHSAPVAKVVVLDAGFPSDRVRPPSQSHETLRKHRLDGEPFVLFVASFEPRKNHLAVFRAWRELIERRGRRHTPLLVCVGSPGWQSDTATSLLQSSRPLRSRVRILSEVSDTDLDQLYRSCLFTLYPSLYEGWGLPVSESLWYGKLPLVASVPALRESGGDLAEYFDPARPDDLLEKLERLINDQPYVTFREMAIKQTFSGRTWREVAEDIIDYLHPMMVPSPEPIDPGPARSAKTSRASLIEIGRYYPISRNTDTRVSPRRESGEVYRMGNGWWAPEPWGCWLKPGRAELLFRLAPALTKIWLQLDLNGNPGSVAEVAVSIADTSPATTATLEPGQQRRISVPLEAAALKDRVARIRISACGDCDLGSLTDGMDPRVVSVGVRGFSLVRSRISAGVDAAVLPCRAAMV